jgi:hypothetical protein
LITSTSFSKSSKRLAVFNKLVTTCLPSVVTTRWLYIEKLVEVVSRQKTELKILKSVTKDEKEWDNKMCTSARGYYDTLQDSDFRFYLKYFQEYYCKLNKIPTS